MTSETLEMQIEQIFSHNLTLLQGRFPDNLNKGDAVERRFCWGPE
jgi:hypothetical protein